MTREQRVRAAWSHLAFVVRGPRGGPFIVGERRSVGKRRFGPYHSVKALEEAFERHLHREISRVDRELKREPPQGRNVERDEARMKKARARRR